MKLPLGFRASGLPRKDRPRPSRHGLAFFYSEHQATAAACFTTNQVKCVHIPIDQRQLQTGAARLIMVNSGCANCCTGPRGVREAEKTITWAADSLGLERAEVLIASTGVIGDFLPMELLAEEIPMLTERLRRDQGLEAQSFQKAAEAIMTTDTTVKISSASIPFGKREIRLWGCAKGAGMIHPKMTLSGTVASEPGRRGASAKASRTSARSLKGKHATMLGFILTDAGIPVADLRRMLERSTENSFNRVTVDGDMSTNDSIFVLANGASGVEIRTAADREKFSAALDHVCRELAKKIAQDGEGASKFLEIRVEGARTEADAQQIAMTVATSPLVKTAAYGEDSNWGRILAAMGRSGVPLNPATVDICFGDLCVFRKGAPTSVTAEAAREPLKAKEVVLRIALRAGKAKGYYWTCDFTGGYVDINARYRT